MPEWTKPQLRAIEARGGDVLVSAAAGSGKTTALTERIIRRIKEGGDISRFLVVTFTTASAADMKKKISEAIRKAASESLDDARLRRQLSFIENADIKTIDAFCSGVVRRYFGQLGLPPTVRVADAHEAELIRGDCMKDAVDALYASDTGTGNPEVDIVALADHLAGSREDGRMEETLLSLYEKTSCLPGRFSVISEAAEALLAAGAEGFLDSSYGAGIKKTAAEGVEYYIRVMEAGCRAIMMYDEFASKYSAGFEGSLSALYVVRAAISSGDYDAAAAAIDAYSPPRLGRATANKPDDVAFFVKKRTELSAFLKKLKNNFFCVTNEALERSILRTVSVCRGIVRVLTEFDRRYSEEKRRRGMLDYDDLEHMTRELLSNDDIAKALSAQYDEVYIDEYQDINETQDEIFSALGAGRRFMVGDVKQSIYGFRGSDPTLFDAYRQKLDTIFMSDNFRCDEPIVKFTNAVCGKLMRYGSVSYEDEDALRHGKTDDGEPEPVKLVLTSAELEAEEVAELAAAEIARGTSPSDIAILMRSAKGRAGAIADALRRRGIAAENGAEDSFFGSPEILLTLSLLHVCDNPLYDIYTASALRSPVFGFTLDELVRLKSGQARPLYRVLRDATLEDGELSGKCRDACAVIERWREESRTKTADEVIADLYRETGLEALLWSENNWDENGSSELAAGNLRALYEYARSYEKNGFCGLHRFLSFIDSMIEGGAASPVNLTGASGAVRIMTVHKSKGLEFPVVILAGCGSKRNEEDARARVLYSRRAGAAMKLRADDEGKSTVMVDTMMRVGVAESILRENMAEEMRNLYVALTRAKSRLYITAGVKEPEAAVASAKLEARFFSAHTALSKKTYIDWILTSLYASGGGDFYKIEIKMPEALPESGTEDTNAAEAAEPDARKAPDAPAALREEIDAYRALIRERLEYKYPFERLGALPAKLSVSRLEPDILDMDAVELVSAPSRDEPDESALAGTATHIFMQFCNFDAAERDAVGEGRRLLSLGYIKEEDFDRIRFSEVEGFFRSNVYARIRAATEVWRERRFNVRLPAADYTENEADRAQYSGETLLVQGVIDCFFREADGGVVLLDYKTDRLSPYELSHPWAAEKKLRERHSRQLSYYAAALTRIFGAPPKQTLVYSMCLGDEVEIK